MTRPALRDNTALATVFLRAMLWLVCGLILISMLIDVLSEGQGLIAKGASAGVFLSYVMQCVSARLGLAKGSVAQVVAGVYFAELAKWIVALVGFALIFKFAQPISAAAVLIGFIVMYVAAMVLFFVLQTRAESAS